MIPGGGRVILALDVETSGLDPTKDRILELGWCLYDVDRKDVILSGGAYVAGVEVSPEIQKITGIRPEWPSLFGHPLASLVETVGLIACHADALVAHNAPFDRAFLTAAGLTREDGRWIDTLTDLPLNGEPDSRKLRYLALDRGLMPSLPHRAQFDAVLTAQLLGTFDFDAVLDRATSPNRIVRALVSYDDREKAKALGFKWQQIEGVTKIFPKTWVKRVKDCDLAALKDAIKAAGFRMEIEP